jgi:hypothetical protein
LGIEKSEKKNIKMESKEAFLLPFEDDNVRYMKQYLFGHYRQAMILYQIYLDLKLVKNWKVIEIKRSETIDLCYLVGMESEVNNFAYFMLMILKGL